MPKSDATTRLAIFGGLPAFDEPLHVGRPNVPDRGRLLARINDLLDHRWLTNDGQYVREFEERIAKTVGVAHCIATANGTLALELAARACGLSGEVIVPAFTFVATAHALAWQQITPVFCDVRADTHNIDPDHVEALITPRTSGIIGVHLWGRVCDVERLHAISQRHGLKLLFDASHAFGCSHQGRMAGSFGLAETFSFHATKIINAFEGGAIVTQSDAIAKRLRLLRNFGFAGYDHVVDVGVNAKMSEASAAMGLTSLESMGEFVAWNRRQNDGYEAALAGLPGFKLIDYDPREQNTFQYVVVEIDAQLSPLSRDQLLDVLWSENVRARRYFFPGCHRMAPYRDSHASVPSPLPVTESLAERLLLLPTGTAVQPRDVATIGQLLRAALGNASQVAERLKEIGPIAPRAPQLEFEPDKEDD